MDEPASELWAEYARYAALRTRYQTAALAMVPVPKVVEIAGDLGLPVDSELAQVPEHELAFAFDLAVHTAPPGRSRAIDRVARQHWRRAEGEAALVLRALDTAWFSVFRSLGPHPEAGLLLEDVLLGGEVWLVDQNLAEQVEPGAIIASRIGRVRGFCISCGVVAPLDEAALAGFQAAIGTGGVVAEELAADARFARLIYQRALGDRIEDSFGRG